MHMGSELFNYLHYNVLYFLCSATCIHSLCSSPPSVPPPSVPPPSRPMGVFEFDNFATGSKAILDAVVMATERGATSIIGQSLSLSYVRHMTVM